MSSTTLMEAILLLLLFWMSCVCRQIIDKFDFAGGELHGMARKQQRCYPSSIVCIVTIVRAHLIALYQPRNRLISVFEFKVNISVSLAGCTWCCTRC